MMDIDRITYIFGSFARRRHLTPSSSTSSSSKRRSAAVDPAPQLLPHHDRCRSTPHQPKKQATAVKPREAEAARLEREAARLECPSCGRRYEDPRVLPCLHTFCLRCLEGMEEGGSAVWYDDDSDVSAQKTDSSSSRKASSGGSGYISDRQDDLPLSPPKRLRCPACDSPADVPPGGVASFPPNYPLQHRLVLETINDAATHLLCDLCTSEVSATSRCMDCAISFCEHCKEVHSRQKSSVEHQVLSLKEARKRGITKVRKQIMCLRHPDAELSIFCSSCYQVICRECVPLSHRGHACEPASRVARFHAADLRAAAERASRAAEAAAAAAGDLGAASMRVEAQCLRVRDEVETFVDAYTRSVEEHKVGLLAQIRQVREEKLQTISKERAKLQQRIRDAKDIAYFIEDLLSDGSEIEVLSFLNPIISKIEKCDNFEQPTDLRLSGSLQFLKEEAVRCPKDVFTVYGVLTTQSVSPDHCHLNVEGLQNLRVGKRVEVPLETRDFDGTPVERGGEEIEAEIRYRDAGVSRSLNVNVMDRRDGTYGLSFVPDVAGKLVLSVTIKGQPIDGSPFPFNVRALKPHIGTFHCCTFCSSGGSKEASCGCEGNMPGGYKGCGHGHEGHPGRRHWSCCGSILEHSECIRSNHHYQFTL
ncbi:unnamed protein product [Phaedon cochleariae]|uniref:B box-type domain-containing protein n=1 Tax=Phaedon cochleariae TaxID=80249 RepID=A0A9P0DHB6_PHACE|nr:unnamed protein product [Phaedon cochleariae]